MKKNWEIKTLGEICNIVKDKPAPFEGEKKYFSTGDINNNKKYTYKFIKYKNKPSRANLYPSNNDVGFAKMKGTNKVFKINEQLSGSIFSTGFCILRCSDKINNNFLYWYLLSDSFQKMKNHFSGDGIMGGIGNVNIKKIQINLPDINTQKKVVSKLDKCFESIDKARENVEKNFLNAKDLFQSHLNKIFSQKSEGNKGYKLGEICELYQGLAINKKTKHLLVEESSLPLWRIKDLINNSPVHFVSEKGYPKKSRVYENEIIYTRTGNSLGLVFMGKNGILHNNSFKVIPINDSISKEYLFWFLKHDSFRKKIFLLASKAAQPDINHSTFKEQIIFYPSLNKQRILVDQIKNLDCKVESLKNNYQQELEALDELKKSVLDKAFNGEL
tara:strand:+ start:3731 stop:4891 length:1161 start_codon:yes stop_codon:yes gene_type:complete